MQVTLKSRCYLAQLLRGVEITALVCRQGSTPPSTAGCSHQPSRARSWRIPVCDSSGTGSSRIPRDRVCSAIPRGGIPPPPSVPLAGFRVLHPGLSSCSDRTGACTERGSCFSSACFLKKSQREERNGVKLNFLGFRACVCSQVVTAGFGFRWCAARAHRGKVGVWMCCSQRFGSWDGSWSSAPSLWGSREVLWAELDAQVEPGAAGLPRRSNGNSSQGKTVAARELSSFSPSPVPFLLPCVFNPGGCCQWDEDSRC